MFAVLRCFPHGGKNASGSDDCNINRAGVISSLQSYLQPRAVCSWDPVSMKGNWKLGQYCAVQDNVWCSRPLLQPSPLICPRPQHPAPRGRSAHIFSKSKESRPYLKVPQFKARALDRTGEPHSLMTLGPKPPLDSESVALGILKEMAVKWFAETQAELLLHTGRLPEWFHGFVLRKEAENLLQNKGLGHFLIRLSDRATGYILSYRGSDRCRHFVIHRLTDGRYMIDGSNRTHRGLAALIDYYMTEAIQPFGEVLTQACQQCDCSDVYDHISFPSSGSSGWPQLEVCEVAAWRPLAADPQPRQRDAPNVRQHRRPPAIPPNASRMSNNEKMAALVNIPIICEDASATPTPPDEMSRLFGDENQVEAKYGQVPKPGCGKPRVAAGTGWTPVTTTPLASDQSKARRPPPPPPHPQWEPNDAIYSLAVEPQPRCNRPLASETVDVVYTEVRVGQWREASDGPPATGSVVPDTPPRLSPNIHARPKPPSPSHCPQKAGRNPRPTSHPHPPNAGPAASQSSNTSSASTDNIYQHVAVAPSSRHQAKPDKDETRKCWFSDWKCK